MAKEFISLAAAINAHLNKPLEQLPTTVKLRVTKELSLIPWDRLTPDQRLAWANQWDFQHDPAMENEQQYWFNHFAKVADIKRNIATWEMAATPTALDLDVKDRKLGELRDALREMDAVKNSAREDVVSVVDQELGPIPVDLIAYPKVMQALSKRLNATPDELAMWIFMEAKNGGISAFLRPSDGSKPLSFRYFVPLSDDYLGPLMSCMFSKHEIEKFEPVERFVIGHALIQRWGNHIGLEPIPFIRAKIREGRLQDEHPTTGLTQGTFVGNAIFPTIEQALFPLSQVIEIEAEDFDLAPDADIATKQVPEVGSHEWRKANAKAAANARHSKPGGARDMQAAMRLRWQSGKYTSKDLCAEQECGSLGISFSAARRALKNAPRPKKQ